MAFWNNNGKREKRAQARLESAPMYSIIGGILFALVFFLILREDLAIDEGRRMWMLVFYGVLSLTLLAYGFLKLLNRERRISEIDCESKKSGSVAIDTNIDAHKDDNEDEDYE